MSTSLLQLDCFARGGGSGRESCTASCARTIGRRQESVRCETRSAPPVLECRWRATIDTGAEQRPPTSGLRWTIENISTLEDSLRAL